MASYFTRAPQQPYCPSSGIDHREVTTSRCSGCNLRNPTFRARSPIPPDAEVIPIGDDSPNPPTKAPPRPSRAATHLAKVPGLVLGYADLERQQAINAKRTASQNRVFRRRLLLLSICRLAWRAGSGTSIQPERVVGLPARMTKNGRLTLPMVKCLRQPSCLRYVLR
jgi:hypothetical protein